MNYQAFTLDITDSVAHLQFNRPETANSMNRDFWHEFADSVRELDRGGEVRALVISAQGKHFCSGMDMDIFANPDPDTFGGEPSRRAEAVGYLVTQLQQVISVLEEVRFPVLTAIQGGCIGGALDLVCAADIRYCTEEAYFVVKETELGMTADLGTLQRLPGLIAPGLARELAYTARKMPAEEAKQSGLVTRVYNSQELMLEEVLSIAQQIAARSPMAVTGCKKMINYARDHGVSDGLQQMAIWQAAMFHPSDMAASLGARLSGNAAEYEPLKAQKKPFS
ncbi:MAG: enoyl-CoA hydratase-related protein [Motiliproteus sp.]|nr:enoyl-CoA hydratase-related protein [Motiliproteus sp.]MCW9052684.1 enoyl-CoA hydratase-related protein [Motiliproteus sp.]